MKLLLRLVYPFTILTIHNKDEPLRAGVIVPPKRANLILAANIPHVELHVLVCHGFNIEADWQSGQNIRRNAGDVRKQLCVPVGMVVTDWLSLSLYKIAG